VHKIGRKTTTFVDIDGPVQLLLSSHRPSEHKFEIKFCESTRTVGKSYTYTVSTPHPFRADPV
jgi:hypothetical protein